MEIAGAVVAARLTTTYDEVAGLTWASAPLHCQTSPNLLDIMPGVEMPLRSIISNSRLLCATLRHPRSAPTTRMAATL